MSFTLSSHFVTHLTAVARSATMEGGDIAGWVTVTVHDVTPLEGPRSNDFTLFFKADEHGGAIQKAQAYADAINAVNVTKAIEEAA